MSDFSEGIKAWKKRVDMKYMIVMKKESIENIRTIEAEVNRLIEKGWRPQGGINVFFQNGWRYYQAMIKDESESED